MPDPPVLVAAATELVDLVDGFTELEMVAPPSITDGALTAEVRIDTTSFAPGPGGLAVEPYETVRLTAGATYPAAPPQATVDHFRWIGYPHVLVGNWLCLFLDVGREWDPATGMTGTINRLWGWFSDAVGGTFDARTSLHHALGGVQHHGLGADTLVVRTAPDDLRPGIVPIAVTARSSQRFDVTGWGRLPGPGEVRGLAIVTHDPMSLGLGLTLDQLLGRLDRPICSGTEHGLERRRGFPSREVATFRLARAAERLAPGEPLRVVVAARNPTVSGAGAYDLAAFVLDADDLATAGLTSGSGKGNLEAVDLTYMRPDDTRPQLHTRRDASRPAAWFEGKWVRLFGAGALGSWIGELVVRAGATRVTVSDPGDVSSGLLVRQNYVEDDVGGNKAEALAARLRAISDTVAIDVAIGATDVTGAPGGRPDLVIDASVTNRISGVLADATASGDQCPPLVQVATDNQTSTLGVITVTPAGGAAPLSDIQDTLHDHVEAHSELEDFGRLWDPDNDGMFAPARGCSVPTFHGSGADAMGIASAAISLLGLAVPAGTTGGYLFALPHTAARVPARTWVGHPSGP